MTVHDVYSLAIALLFEKPNADADFKRGAIPILNILLMEALPYQNLRLCARGERELSSAPMLQTMEDGIPFDEPIVRIALPFGLASYYYQDEVDNFKAQDFRGRFIVALEESKKYMDGTIIDIYGGVD